VQRHSSAQTPPPLLLLYSTTYNLMFSIVTHC
jgi:hypothetical protein